MSSTDVLKDATCIAIDDRIYRLLPIRDSLNETEENEARIVDADIEEDDAFDVDLPIVHQGNRFYITFHIPSTLIGRIVGAQFKNIKCLEQQFSSKINVPSQRNKDSNITIHASTKKDVSLTYFSMINRVNSVRLKNESAHFISIPINAPNIQESFLEFKNLVLKIYGKNRGVEASIFQKPGKLHVTIALPILLDERDNENAIALLTKSASTVLKDFSKKEFLVQVKGLEYMNDDRSEVDVLYAKLQQLDEDDSLQELADKILKDFVDASLSKREQRVKLHVTLMNTIFREQLENSEQSYCERTTFDATNILKDFSDYDFGQIVISEIHISIRYTEGSDGYYKALHKLKLNSLCG